MSTDSKGSHEDKKLQSAASPGPALLTRADAAALLSAVSPESTSLIESTLTLVRHLKTCATG
jgi:hypothetical protein